MVKFEIDKWYKVCNGNFNIPHDDLYYVKSPKIINDIITVDQYLYNGYLEEEGKFGHVGDYTFTEVPLSEIQWILPDGHSDKIVKEAFNKNYKVGIINLHIGTNKQKTLTEVDSFSDYKKLKDDIYGNNKADTVIGIYKDKK